MKILIISTRDEDNQTSMKKYGELVCSIYKKNKIEYEVVSAPLFTRKIHYNKWTSYVDWMIFFPFYLFLKSVRYDLVHIIDHSKAYLSYSILGKAKVLSTCHDMIAIRSAIDMEDIELTSIGKYLQRLCLRGLMHSDIVVCVSKTTLDQYCRYGGENGVVVLSTLNANFAKVGVNQLNHNMQTKLVSNDKFSFLENLYVFHVGSNLNRKNRSGIIRAFNESQFSKDGYLVFAGQKLDKELKLLISELGLDSKVLDLGFVDHDELNYLYSNSVCLLFPSFSEGFGWPVLEAQASGTAVICSNKESLQEVGQYGTILVDPSDLASMSKAIDLLQSDDNFRENLIDQGYVNLSKYSLNEMSKGYINAINDLLRD